MLQGGGAGTWDGTERVPIQAGSQLLAHAVGEFTRGGKVQDVNEVAHQIAVATPPVRSVPEPSHGLLVKTLSLVDWEFISQFCHGVRATAGWSVAREGRQWLRRSVADTTKVPVQP